MKGTVGYTRGYWLFHLFCAIAFRFSVLQAAFVTRQDATVDESDLTIETFNVSSLCHIEGASSKLIVPTYAVRHHLLEMLIECVANRRIDKQHVMG